MLQVRTLLWGRIGAYMVSSFDVSFINCIKYNKWINDDRHIKSVSIHAFTTNIQVSLRTALNHHHCTVTTTCAYCYHHHNHRTCQCPEWVHSTTTRYTMHWHKAALACLPWKGPGLSSTSPAKSRSSRRKTQGLASRPQSCWDAARNLYLQKEMCQQLLTRIFCTCTHNAKCWLT